MIPTLTFERSLREDKISFEKFAVAYVDTSNSVRPEASAPDLHGPILIMTMDRSCRRIWSMTKHLRVLHDPEFFARGERLLALSYFQGPAVFASFVVMKKRVQAQAPAVSNRNDPDSPVSPDADSSAVAVDESSTRVTFWNHKLERIDEIMIGDRHYSRFAQDPGGEEVLLVGDSGFAAYRLRAEARGGKNAAPPCSLSKVQSAQLDMGTSADQVVSVKYLSPDAFAVATMTSLRIFIKALPRDSISVKKSWLRTNLKPPVYVPLEYTECVLPDSSTAYGRSGAHIADIEVTTASNLVVIAVGYSDGFISLFSSAWLLKALQLVADAGRRGVHPDDVARAPGLNRVMSFRAFREAAPIPLPGGSPSSAAISMSLKIYSGSPISATNIAFSIIAMDCTGVICHYGIPQSTLFDIESADTSKIKAIPPLIGVHNMGFDKNREIFQSDQTLRRIYSRWEPTSTPKDMPRGDQLLSLVSLLHGHASIVASIGGQMCFLNINELQAEVTRCLPPMESQMSPCYSLVPDDLHRFDSALAFESSVISDDDEKISIEDDRIVLVVERNASVLNWVNSVSDKVLRTINLANLLGQASHRQPASYGKIAAPNDFGTASFSMFSITTSSLIVGFSTGSVCVVPMAMLGRGRSASGSAYIRLNTKAVHSSAIRKMIICPLLDGSGDFLITGDDRGVVASWKINKSLESSVLDHLWTEGPHIGWIVHLELFYVPLRPDPGKAAELERIQSTSGAPKSREIVILTACSGGVIKAWRLLFPSGKLSLLASLNVGSKPVVSSVSALTFLMVKDGSDLHAAGAEQMPTEIKVSQDFRIVCICGRSNGAVNSFIMSNDKISASSNCVPLSTFDLHRQSITAQAVMPSVCNTEAFKVGSGNTYLASSKISLVIASEDCLSLIHIESDGYIHLDGYQSIRLPHSLSNRQIRSIFPQVIHAEPGKDPYINCIVVRDEIVTKHVVDAKVFPSEWETLTSTYYERMLLGAIMRESRTATPSSAARSRLGSRPRPRTGASEGRVATSGTMSVSRPQSPAIIELRPSLEQDEANVVPLEPVLQDDEPMPELEGSSSNVFSVTNSESLAFFGAKTFFPSHSTRTTAPFCGKEKSIDIERQLIATLFSIKKDQILIELYKKICVQNSIPNVKLIPSDVALEVMHGYSKFSSEEIMMLMRSLGIDDVKGLSFIQICKVLATLRFVSEQAHSNYRYKQKKYKEMRSSKPVVTYNSMGERMVQRDKPIRLEPRVSDGIVKGVHTQVKKLWDFKASKVLSLMESDFNEKGFFSDVFPAIVDRIPLSFQGILKANRISLPTVWMPDASNYVELGRAIKIARSLFDRRLGLQRDFVLAMSPNDVSAPANSLVNGLPTMAELVVQYFERNYGGPELNVSHTKVAYFIEALFQYSRYPVIDTLRKFACPEESGIVVKESTLWFFVEARDFLYSRNCVQKSSDLVAVYLEGSLTVSESISVESSTSVGFNQWERIPRREAALCVVEMVQRRGAFGSIAVEKALKIIEKLPSLNAAPPIEGSLLSNSVNRLELECSHGSADEEWIDLESFLDVLTTFINTLTIDIEVASARLFNSDNSTKNRKFVSNGGIKNVPSVDEISKTFDNLRHLSYSLMYYDKTRLGLISSANFDAVISREGDLALGLLDAEHRTKFLAECRRLFSEENSQGVVYIDILGVLLSAAMQGFGSGLVRGADAITALSHCTRGLEDDLANTLVFLLGNCPSPYRLHNPLWTLGSFAIQSIVDGGAANTSSDWKKGTLSLNTDGRWFINTNPVSDEPGMLSINKIEPASHSSTGIGEVALGVDGSEWRTEAFKMDTQINREPILMTSPQRSETEAAYCANTPLIAAVSQSLSDSPSSSALIALPVSEQYAMSTIGGHILFDDQCDAPMADASIKQIKNGKDATHIGSGLDYSLEAVGSTSEPSVTDAHKNLMDPPQNAVGAESRLNHFSPKHARSIFNYLEDDVHDKTFYAEEAILRSMRIPVINRIIRSRGKDEPIQLESMSISTTSLGDLVSAADTDGNRSIAASEYRKVLSEEEDAALEMARERERIRLLLKLRAETAKRNKELAKQHEREIRKKMMADGERKAQKKTERAKIIDQMHSSSSNPEIRRVTINKKPVTPKASTPKPTTAPAPKISKAALSPKSDAEDAREVASTSSSVGSNSNPVIQDGSNDIESEGSLESVGSDEISLPSVKERVQEPFIDAKTESNTVSIEIPEIVVSDEVVVQPVRSPTVAATTSEPQTPISVAASVRLPKPSIESKLKELSKSKSPATPKVDPRVEAINQRKLDAKKELDNIKQMKANDFNVLLLASETSSPTKKFAHVSKNHPNTEFWVGADDAKEAEPTTLLGRKINRFLEVMQNVRNGTNLHPRRYDEDVDGRKFFMPQIFADDIRFDPVSAPAYETGWFHEQLEEDREIRDRLRLEPSKDFSDLTRLINFRKERNRAKDELVVEERDLRPAEYTSIFRTNRVDWNTFMEREKAEAERNAETDTLGASASRRSTFTAEHAFVINKKKSNLPHTSFLGQKIYLLPLGYVVSEKLRKDNYLYYQVDVPSCGTILTVNLKCHLGSATLLVLWRNGDLPTTTHFDEKADCIEMNNFEAQIASHAPGDGSIRSDESDSSLKSSRRAIIAVLSLEEGTDFTMWAISSSSSKTLSQPIANVSKLIKELNLLASRDSKDLAEHFPICRQEVRKQVLQESLDEANNMTNTIQSIVAKSVQDSITLKSVESKMIAHEIVRSVIDDDEDTMERFVTRAGTMAVARAMKATILAPGLGALNESNVPISSENAAEESSVGSRRKNNIDLDDAYHYDHNSDEHPLHVAKLERVLSQSGKSLISRREVSSSSLTEFPMLRRHPTLRDLARTSAEGLDSLLRKPKPIHKNLTFVPTPISYKLSQDRPLMRSSKR